jgi:alcohol dehydrogenase (cytochrome c)
MFKSLCVLTLALPLIFVLPPSLQGQVTSDRLTRAAEEPRNWLTYSGTYDSKRYSTLSQITPANAKDLELKGVFQGRSLHPNEATPLVVDGIMYTTQPPNDVVAFDAKSGGVFWVYQYQSAPNTRPCCGFVNRGLAMLGDTLFMGTLDAHLVALDAKTGRPVWNIKVAEASDTYSITLAPLIVKDKVIVGLSDGDFGSRGFIAAYDSRTGNEAWRFHTVPEPGEPGHETWPGDLWKTGGGAPWLTGSYDPELNLLYWGVGNPSGGSEGARKGFDLLYTGSVVALDADSGKLKWYFQFTPDDYYDYDALQIPVLVDMDWQGTPRKLMLWGHRNGIYYVLDRTNGKFLFGRPFAEINWASGLDAKGRPIRTPQGPNAVTYPGNQGSTNWYSPSFSPRTGLVYYSTWENYGGMFRTPTPPPTANPTLKPTDPRPEWPRPEWVRRTAFNTWTEATGSGAVIALDPKTGDRKWRFPMHDVTTSGLVTTATDVLFTGSREGYFHALDARTGELLWKVSLGGPIVMGPITYEVDGQQLVAATAGNSVFIFGLRNR